MAKKKFEATVKFTFETEEDTTENDLTMYEGDSNPTHGCINFQVEFGKKETCGQSIYDVFDSVEVNLVEIKEVK